MKKWLKKGFRAFFVKEQGSVSIYAIMITLLLFLFNAVLIDYVRIMAAEREADQAAKAAIRSVMSSYNEKAKGYGLFGFDGGQSEADEIFQNVFAEHLKKGEGDYFQFVDTAPISGQVSTDIDSNRMLANTEILKHQILEEMKYVAPMQIGESLIEGFLGISEAMEAVSTLAKVYKEIREDLDDREAELNKAEEQLAEAKKIIEGLESKINGTSNSSFPKLSNLNTILNHLKPYHDIRENEGEDQEDWTDEEKDQQKKDIDDADQFETNALNFFKSIDSAIDQMMFHLNEAESALKAAEILNKNIADVLENEMESSDENYSEAKDAANLNLSETSGGDLDGAIEGVEHAKSELKKLVFEDSFFEDVLKKIDEAKQKVDDGSTQGSDTMKVQIIALINMSGQGWSKHWMKTSVEKLQGSHTAARLSIQEAHQMVVDGIEEMKQTDEKTAEEVEAEEKQRDENLKDANESLKEIFGIGEGGETSQAYTDLLALVAKYNGAVEGEQTFRTDDVDDLTDDTMNLVDAIFNSIGSMLLNARDELYINEYILTKFDHHNFSASGPESFFIDNNEVEFIIYGRSNQKLNFQAAMTELYAVRFAVNLVEAFTDPDVRAFGKFMWVAAIAYSLRETKNDLNDISNGMPIQFFDGIAFDTFYKDYLRLFLFLHPEGNKIPRLMARIEQNSSADLTQLPTYIKGEATASVRLWFLPGITEMLGNTGVLDGQVKNNRYHINKEVIYSY